MSTESLTMRKTAQELGISQLRVRELIKKGRLEAEKVSDGSGEHWEISRESIESFRQERRENSSNGTPSGGPSWSDGPGPQLATLLPELEQQLERVKALIQEISRAQAYLDGLRKTQSRLEEEIATVRRRVADEPRGGDGSDGGADAGATDRGEPDGERASEPAQAETPRPGETEEPAAPEAPKSEDRGKKDKDEDKGKSKGKGKSKDTGRKGETNVAAALRDAGVAEGDQGAEKDKKSDA